MSSLNVNDKYEIENAVAKQIKQHQVPIDIELVAEKNISVFEIGYVLSPKVENCTAKKELPRTEERLGVGDLDIAAAVLWASPNGLHIIVNEDEFDDESEWGRFSVAHEFGHVILDEDVWSPIVDAFERGDTPSVSVDLLSNPHREARANYFARAILMPIKPFCETVRLGYSMHASDLEFLKTKIIHRISSEIGKLYRVHPDTARDRMEDLGFIAKIEEACHYEGEHLL